MTGRRTVLRDRRRLLHHQQQSRAATTRTGRVQAQVDLLRRVIKNSDEATAHDLTEKAVRYLAGLVATHTAAPRKARRTTR